MFLSIAFHMAEIHGRRRCHERLGCAAAAEAAQTPGASAGRRGAPGEIWSGSPSHGRSPIAGWFTENPYEPPKFKWMMLRGFAGETAPNPSIFVGVSNWDLWI